MDVVCLIALKIKLFAQNQFIMLSTWNQNEFTENA